MKKINIIFYVLLSLLGFSSCQDQMGVKINPKAENGTISFHLNQTQLANFTYVLEDANANSDMEALTCVQADYGFTAAVNYTIQVGFDSIFAAGTFQSLPTTVYGQKVSMNTLEMDKAIIALYPGGTLPDPVVEKNIFVRLMGVISTSTTNPLDTVPTVKPLYSNAIMLKVLPYVLPLFPYTDVAALRPWYIIGLGDGAWHNDVAHIGSSIYPLSIVPGKKYNLKGDGEYTFTGYFSASRSFKLIGPELDWSKNTFGMTGTNYIHNGGDNISVPADGYYTLTLNSIDNTLKIVPATAPTASYATMGLIGAMGDSNWATDLAMSPAETTNNHVWYINYSFTADSQCKFRANGTWDVNWGTPSATDGDPIYSAYGIGSNGGKNILGKTGSYVIVFNDVDGSYFFFKK